MIYSSEPVRKQISFWSYSNVFFLFQEYCKKLFIYIFITQASTVYTFFIFLQRDMPGQAELLVKRMKKNPKIDFQNDWKVITIFVGGNDLCRFCYNKVGTQMESRGFF